MRYSQFNRHAQCRNINLLPIVYALRPRLRIRLTLGGFTFPRKPQVFGEQDFHLLYRYSYRHSHLLPLQCSLRYTFSADSNALLPPASARRHDRAAASVSYLVPIIIGAELLDQSAVTHCLNGGCF